MSELSVMLVMTSMHVPEINTDEHVPRSSGNVRTDYSVIYIACTRFSTKSGMKMLVWTQTVVVVHSTTNVGAHTYLPN